MAKPEGLVLVDVPLIPSSVSVTVQLEDQRPHPVEVDGFEFQAVHEYTGLAVHLSKFLPPISPSKSPILILETSIALDLIF